MTKEQRKLINEYILVHYYDYTNINENEKGNGNDVLNGMDGSCNNNNNKNNRFDKPMSLKEYILLSNQQQQTNNEQQQQQLIIELKTIFETCIQDMANIRQAHFGISTHYLKATSKGTGQSSFKTMLKESIDHTKNTISN